MTDQPAVQNLTNTTPDEPPAPAPATNAVTFTQDQVEQLIKERLEREKKASEKKAQEAADKAAADAAVKNGEFQKLAEQREKELNEARATLAEKELNEKRHAVALKTGLPPAFALRLQGSTDEELEADAKTILEALPKPPEKTPGINPTNPPAGSDQKETKEQALRRLGLL